MVLTHSISIQVIIEFHAPSTLADKCQQSSQEANSFSEVWQQNDEKSALELSLTKTVSGRINNVVKDMSSSLSLTSYTFLRLPALQFYSAEESIFPSFRHSFVRYSYLVLRITENNSFLNFFFYLTH